MLYKKGKFYGTGRLAPQRWEGLPLSSRLLDPVQMTMATQIQIHYLHCQNIDHGKSAHFHILRPIQERLKWMICILSQIIREFWLTVICIQSHAKQVTHSTSYFMFWKNGLMKKGNFFNNLIWSHTTWSLCETSFHMTSHHVTCVTASTI